MLLQVDKLVLLLESPVFGFLRLQLLQPQRHRSLVLSLYGILMLLPQSTAFDMLSRRLRCVGPLAMLATLPDSNEPQEDFADLVEHFRLTQNRLRSLAAATAAATTSK